MLHIGRSVVPAPRSPARPRLHVIGWLIASVALLATACAPGQAAPTAGPTPPGTATRPATNNPPGFPAFWRRGGPVGDDSHGPIARIGAALSLSGPGAGTGLVQREAIRLARDEINASRMLGSTRLEVVIEDDASDRDAAAAVFRKFIDSSHVVAIVGPTLSSVALAVDPIAQEAGVPVLAISNPAGGITEIGDFIFRDCLAEAQINRHTVKVLKARLPLGRAALLYADTDATRSGSSGFKLALHDLGVHIVSEQTFGLDDTDMSSQLMEIASSHPDALFVSAPPHRAGSIVLQARGLGLDGLPIVGSSAFNSASVLRAAGEAAEGLIVGGAWSASSASARNQQFIQSYRARYGTEPDQFAAQAYAGIYLIAGALKDANTASDPRAVREALERLSGLETPLGKLSFSPSHEASYPPIVQVVRGGRLEPF